MKRLDIFHKLLLLAFLVEIWEFTGYYIELLPSPSLLIYGIAGDYIESISSRFEPPRYEVDGIYYQNIDSPLELLSVFPLFFSAALSALILLLFITGCIRAKIWKKSTTINYWLLMLILFLNGFFLKFTLWIFLPLIAIFGLTRKYWEIKSLEKP